MMKWFKIHWRWTVLNLFALAVMANLVWQTFQVEEREQIFSPTLVSSGKWAIRFLLLSLLMTPLNTLFGWRSAVKLRKSAGLWAFGFGTVHFVLNIAGLQEEWLRHPIPDEYAALGVIGLSILTVMAITSNRWAMKQLGKGWKRLHRLVYVAGILLILHAFMEALNNKRVVFSDPEARLEIGLYMGILAILLIVRIPKVRTTLAGLKYRRSKKESLTGSKTSIS